MQKEKTSEFFIAFYRKKIKSLVLFIRHHMDCDKLHRALIIIHSEYNQLHGVFNQKLLGMRSTARCG